MAKTKILNEEVSAMSNHEVTTEKTPEEKKADAIAKAMEAVSRAEASVENARTEHDRTQAKLTLADINLTKARGRLARLQTA